MPEPLDYQRPETAPADDYRTSDLAWSSVVLTGLGPLVMIFAVSGMTLLPASVAAVIVLTPCAAGVACAIVAIRRIAYEDPTRRRGLTVAIIGGVIGAAWMIMALAAVSRMF